jgi:hypothetical protein
MRRPRPRPSSREAPAQWYRQTIDRFALLVLRPGGPRVNTVLFYGSAISGVLIALVGSRSPLLPIAALPLAAFVLAGVSALYRWTWPWQRAYLREGRRSDIRLSTILGRPIDKSAAEAWLAASSEAPVSDRILVLKWLGRDEEADALIPALPTITPLELYTRDSSVALRDWRMTGILDMRAAVARLPSLDPSERDRAASTIAFWHGVAEVGAGHDLRGVSAPQGGRLSPRYEVSLWALRIWPYRWLVGMFLVTWIPLGVLGLVAAR